MTKIEWTNQTWNPVTGCTPCSEGCRNCYAEKFALRLMKNPRTSDKYRNGFAVTLHPEELVKPLSWRKPRMVFVCSMGDLFHEDVPFLFIDKVMAIIAICPEHTFQILTKRSRRMLEYFSIDRNSLLKRWDNALSDLDLQHLPATNCISLALAFPQTCEWFWPMINLWLGVTAENQQMADKRVEDLSDISAVVRFVSVEPMLGPVDLSRYLPRLDWVICGGETGTGPNIQPLIPNWARRLRIQCDLADVPFFFKSWGEYLTIAPRAFQTFQHWWDKAQSWLGQIAWNRKIDKCIDQNGRHCKKGKDFQEAEYPVFICKRIGRKNTGHELDGKMYREMPAI
jgi:protein gp37